MNELHYNTNLIYDLHHGAATGNVGLVKFALDHGAPIDCVVNGLMPLQVACVSDNNLATVQYLIDRGAYVNAQRWHRKEVMDKSQPTGSTALHVACANGCTRIADLLLRNGASVHLKDKYGSTPIDVAGAKSGHVDMIRKLLEAATAAAAPCSRMDKPLPIPIQSRSPNDALPQPQHNVLPDLSSFPSHISSVSSSSDNDWYGVGIVNKYDESEQYLKVLERRLSASLDDPYLGNYSRLDVAVSTLKHASSTCHHDSDCNYYDKQNSPWHPPACALQMSLDSLNRASRNSLDVLSKKPDYDMISLATATVTATAAVAAATANRGPLKSNALSKFLFWPWRKSRPLPVG